MMDAVSAEGDDGHCKRQREMMDDVRGRERERDDGDDVKGRGRGIR